MKPSRFATFPQGILHPVVCDYISIIGVLKLVILNSIVASSIFMMVVHISMNYDWCVFSSRCLYILGVFYRPANPRIRWRPNVWWFNSINHEFCILYNVYTCIYVERIKPNKCHVYIIPMVDGSIMLFHLHILGELKPNILELVYNSNGLTFAQHDIIYHFYHNLHIPVINTGYK